MKCSRHCKSAGPASLVKSCCYLLDSMSEEADEENHKHVVTEPENLEVRAPVTKKENILRSITNPSVELRRCCLLRLLLHEARLKRYGQLLRIMLARTVLAPLTMISAKVKTRCITTPSCGRSLLLRWPYSIFREKALLVFVSP